MGSAGSNPPRTELHPIAAVAVLLFGLGAMLGTAQLTAAYGLRAMFLLSETALVLPGLIALVARPVPVGASLGVLALDRRRALYALGAGATLWVASLGLFELQAAVWPPDPGYLEAFRRLHELLRPSGVVDAFVSVAAIALVPALCEETLLRGILLPSLARSLGPAAGVLVSAFLFGAIHLDPYRFPFTFGVGIALGVLRLRAGSLLAPTLAHALLNTITFAAAPFAGDPTAETASPLLGAALLALGMTASTAAIASVGSPPKKM